MNDAELQARRFTQIVAREKTRNQLASVSQTMHLQFHSSILDYLHLTPPAWSITTSAMKICSVLFSLLDTDHTNQLEEHHIRALLIYLSNIPKSRMTTIFFKLGIPHVGMTARVFSLVQISINPARWN